MRYNEAFFSGFADEIEKLAVVGLLARGATAAAKYAPKLLSAGKSLVAKAPAALKAAPGKAWGAVKKNPMTTATTAMIAQPMLAPGPKVKSVQSTSGAAYQKTPTY